MSRMNSIILVGLYPDSPCVILLLDVHIEYITVVILALSLGLKIGSHIMSLVQVSGCSLGNFRSSISFAAIQIYFAWMHSIRACIKDSEVALQIPQVLLSIICRRERVL
jgi:hypothetical protein